MMDFGRRLLPQVVDYFAEAEPTRVYASIPNSSDHLSDGFQDVTMAKLAAMVNRLCWWLHDSLGVGNLDTMAYIGPADIRYALVFLTAVKCRYKVRERSTAPRGNHYPSCRITANKSWKGALHLSKEHNPSKPGHDNSIEVPGSLLRRGAGRRCEFSMEQWSSRSCHESRALPGRLAPDPG